jgi:hypothetical protein
MELSNRCYPDDIIYESGVVFHQINWDVTRADGGLVFANENKLIKHIEPRDYRATEKRFILGNNAFTAGVHFWKVKILAGLCMIGVVCEVTSTIWNDDSGKSGVAYHDGNGSIDINCIRYQSPIWPKTEWICKV